MTKNILIFLCFFLFFLLINSCNKNSNEPIIENFKKKIVPNFTTFNNSHPTNFQYNKFNYPTIDKSTFPNFEIPTRFLNYHKENNEYKIQNKQSKKYVYV